MSRKESLLPREPRRGPQSAGGPVARELLCQFRLSSLCADPAAECLKRRLQRRRAFTLIELLTVVAIMILLMVLGVAGLRNLTSPNSHQSARNLAFFLEDARARSMARNTYVWVGFHEEPAPGQALSVAAVASLDGTSSIQQTNLVSLGAVTAFKGIALSETAAPGTLEGATGVVRGGGPTFSVRQRTYGSIVLFAPDGQASLPPAAAENPIAVTLKRALGAPDATSLLIQPFTGRVIYD